jgi:hypothetical protein
VLIALIMEAVRTSKISVSFYESTWHNVSEESYRNSGFSIHLLIYLSVCLLACRSVYLYVYQSIRKSINQSFESELTSGFKWSCEVTQGLISPFSSVPTAHIHRRALAANSSYHFCWKQSSKRFAPRASTLQLPGFLFCPQCKLDSVQPQNFLEIQCEKDRPSVASANTLPSWCMRVPASVPTVFRFSWHLTGTAKRVKWIRAGSPGFDFWLGHRFSCQSRRSFRFC